MTSIRFPLPARGARIPAMAGLALALACLLSAPAPAAAQFGDFGAARTGKAVAAGARVGYDFRADAPALGAYLRSPVLWKIAVQATGDLTFLDRLTERQFTGDLLFDLGPGFAVGGGVAVRNSVFERLPQETGGRETRTGYTVVAVLGGIGPGRVATGIELRFTAVDDFRSQLLAIQVGIPLFRW